MIPQEILDRVVRETDIVELVGSHVELRRSGRNFVGLCPFHVEKTPSFAVNPDRLIWKCFGCGEGGDAIKFLQKTQGLTFPEAVRDLAGRLGIPVPESRGGEGRDRKVEDRKRAVLRKAAGFYQRALESPEGKEYRRYLEARGIGAEVVQRFELGATRPGWDPLVRAAEEWGVSPAALESLGLARRNDRGGYRDFLVNRLIFPIHDERGRPVAFGGRTLEDQGPKYLNSPETSLFRKSDRLYGLHQARPRIARQRRVVVMEGYTDVLLAHQAGVDLAVSTLGTALTPSHARILGRGVDRVDLVYDGDAAGLRAARRGLEVLVAAGVPARIVVLPDGLDPADVIVQRGPDAFLHLLEQAAEPIDFVVSQARAQHDIATVDGKAAAIRDCLEHVRQAPSLERTLLLERVAEAFQVRTETCARVLRQQESRRGGRGPSGPEEPPEEAPGAVRGYVGGVGPAEGVVAVCLQSPDLLPQALDRVSPDRLGGAAGAILRVALDVLGDCPDAPLSMVLGRLHDAPEAYALAVRLDGHQIGEPAQYLEDCLRRLDEQDLRASSGRLDAQEAFAHLQEQHRMRPPGQSRVYLDPYRGAGDRPNP